MKKTYTRPELELELINEKDIITTSVSIGGAEDTDVVTDFDDLFGNN